MWSDHPPWMLPDTEFVLEMKDRGDEFDTPTGRVLCCHCGHGHQHIEHIHHALDCPVRERREQREQAAD